MNSPRQGFFAVIAGPQTEAKRSLKTTAAFSAKGLKRSFAAHAQSTFSPERPPNGCTATASSESRTHQRLIAGRIPRTTAFAADCVLSERRGAVDRHVEHSKHAQGLSPIERIAPAADEGRRACCKKPCGRQTVLGNRRGLRVHEKMGLFQKRRRDETAFGGTSGPPQRQGCLRQSPHEFSGSRRFRLRKSHQPAFFCRRKRRGACRILPVRSLRLARMRARSLLPSIPSSGLVRALRASFQTRLSL